MKILRKTLILCLITVHGFSQEADSLLKAISAMPDDTVKVKQFIEQGLGLIPYDSAVSVTMGQKALALSKRLSYSNGIISAYYLLGDIKIKYGDQQGGINLLRQSYEAALKSGDFKTAGKRQYNIGNAYCEIMELDKAAQAFKKSIELHEKIGNKAGIAYAYIGLGEIFRTQKNFDKALEYHKQALDLAIESGDKKGISSAHNNVGMLKARVGQYEEAMKHYNEALRLKKEMGDRNGEALTMNKMAIVYAMKTDWEKAVSILNEVVAIKREIGDHEGEVTALINLGENYYNLRKLDLAVDSYKKAIEIAKKVQYNEPLVHALDMLALTYYQKKDYLNAYLTTHEHAELKDSIFSAESSKQVAQMEAQYQNEKKSLEIKNLNNEKELQKAEIKRQNTQMIAFGAGFVIMLVMALIVYRSYRLKKKANHIISLQKQEVERQKAEVTHQKEIVEEKQKEILDSIKYAQRIQKALIASDSLLSQNLSRKQSSEAFADDYFVFFQPKDIVSGDFYWATRHENKFYIAVCDSTGHGVPGAFMSLLNISYLNEAINEKLIAEPGKILDHVRQKLIDNISQDGQKDGMDGILLCFETDNKGTIKSVSYAAAHNPPVFITAAGIIEGHADKMPVGKGERTDPFKTNHLHLEKGDQVYLFTDGYPDQFGGPQGKKFKYKPLYNLLGESSQEPANDQKEKLKQIFLDWKGDLEQIDDVCIFGLRV